MYLFPENNTQEHRNNCRLDALLDPIVSISEIDKLPAGVPHLSSLNKSQIQMSELARILSLNQFQGYVDNKHRYQ